MHEYFVAEVVRPGDIFVNAFSGHQQDIEEHGYPGKVEQILSPYDFTKRLCPCRAIISANFHGTVMGLHMGVPTFGAFHSDIADPEIPELMLSSMQLPDQVFFVDDYLTRDAIDLKVEAVRRVYAEQGRRSSIHTKLSDFFEEFRPHAHHVLFDLIGIEQQQEVLDTSGSERAGTQQTAFKKKDPATITAVPVNFNAQLEASPPIIDTFISHGNALETLQTAWGKSTETKARRRVTVEAAQPIPDGPESPGSTKSEAEPIDSNLRVRNRGSSSGAWKLKRFFSTVFILLSIVVLALCPSVGISDGSREKAPEKETAGGGGVFNGPRGEVEMAERCGSDSELLEPERSPKLTVGRPAPLRITVITSKIVFVLNFSLWVLLAVGFNAYGKIYLRETRDPIGLLILQGLMGVILLGAFGYFGVVNLSPGKNMTRSTIKHSGLAAIFHSGQAVLTLYAVLMGGVSITSALKATEPVAAAVFSYFLLGKTVSPPRIGALFIIMAGIILLTSKSRRGTSNGSGGGGSGDLDSTVLTSAFITTVAVCFNALRNVIIKKGGKIPPHQTLFACSVAAAVVGASMLLPRLAVHVMQASSSEPSMAQQPTSEVESSEAAGGLSALFSAIGINGALCFVGYNLASFNLLAHLSPVGHAVGNSCKRIIVFASGLTLLGEEMGAWQLGGASIAILGVLVYNISGTSGK